MPDTPNSTEYQDQTQNNQEVGIPPLAFNADDYRSYVGEFDLTEEQQTELLYTLWQIMVQFVDLGFNIHPLQSVTNCEEKTVDLVAMIKQSITSETDHDKGGVDEECNRQ